LLVVGQYGEGAYGPTILLKLLSPAAVEWLHDVMRNLANDPKVVIDLAAQPGVSLLGIRSWKLRRSSQPGDVALRGPASVVAEADFEWEMDEFGWLRAAGLLEPLLRGKSGHQYLSREGHDAALVEVSFGEPDVQIAGA
jgi:hypothetical protein